MKGVKEKKLKCILIRVKINYLLMVVLQSEEEYSDGDDTDGNFNDDEYSECNDNDSEF